MGLISLHIVIHNDYNFEALPKQSSKICEFGSFTKSCIDREGVYQLYLPSSMKLLIYDRQKYEVRHNMQILWRNTLL